MRASFAAASLLLMIWCAPSYPQQVQKAANHASAPASQQRGSQAEPLYVQIAPTPDAKARAKAEEEEKSAKRKADADLVKFTAQLATYTSDLATYTLALIGVGALQVVIFIAQLIFIWRQETATKAIERAYVSASPIPPGINFASHQAEKDSTDKPAVLQSCVLQITNHGSTPSRVTSVALVFKVLPKGEKLPIVPDYSGDVDQQFSGAFLVKEASIYLTHAQRKMDPNVANAEAAGIRDGSLILYVFGYVDYIDVFESPHRSGFGRVYDPSLDDPARFVGGPTKFEERSNLAYLDEGLYDYDDPRRKDEGHGQGKKPPT